MALVRSDPQVITQLVSSAIAVELPSCDGARLAPCDVTEWGARELRADTVFVLPGDNGTTELAVVVEVQFGRDESKTWSWPAYLVNVRARLKCPTMLVVVSPDRAIAKWCRKPIETGHPRLVLEPVVVGPDAVPPVVDPAEAARQPSLAVLSCLAYSDTDGVDPVLRATLEALNTIDRDDARRYHDVLRAVLSKSTLVRMEQLMLDDKYTFKSDFALMHIAQGRAEGRAEGLAEGEAKAVLAVLKARGLKVSRTIRQRVLGCRDVEQLKAWVERAVTAERASDVFG